MIQTKLIVFLNPGHGVDTAGKRSPVWPDGSQLFEWKFNRTIVNGLMQYKIPGIQWCPVITENIDISLQERVRRIQAIIRRNTHLKYLLLDIHGNAAQTASAKGLEVWTTIGKTLSDQVAEIYLKQAASLNRKLRKDTTDGDGDWEKNWYIIKNVSCPAILTENGFYTNEEECHWMNSQAGQAQIIGVHLATCIEWLKIIS